MNGRPHEPPWASCPRCGNLVIAFGRRVLDVPDRLLRRLRALFGAGQVAGQGVGLGDGRRHVCYPWNPRLWQRREGGGA